MVKLLLKKDQRNASEKVAKAYKSKRPITIILHTYVYVVYVIYIIYVLFPLFNR